MIGCENVGMLSIADEKKKINAATLKQFFGVKHNHISIYLGGSPKGSPGPLGDPFYKLGPLSLKKSPS